MSLRKCNFCGVEVYVPCADHEQAKSCRLFVDQLTTGKISEVIQNMTSAVVKRLDDANEVEHAMAAHRLRVICDYIDMSGEILKKAAFAARDALAAIDRAGVARAGRGE